MPLLTANQVLDGAWRVDRSRSSVDFHVRHFGVATVRGRFSSFAGRVQVHGRALHVHGHVDVASVDTGEPIRDRRLRTEFFDADGHPAISLEAGAPAPGAPLRGRLTIRGVTRPVKLAVTAEAIDEDTIRLRAHGEIRRSDFGLEWDALRQAGRLLVADRVRLSADVVLERV